MNDRKEYLISEKDGQGGEFMPRLLKFLLLSVSFALLLCMTLNVGVVKAEQLTGCLKKGKLSKLALGDSPLKPCKRGETEASIASRVVISGSVDLDSTGDVVLETFDSLGRRRLGHHVEILVPGLTTDDPPAFTLYRRRSADAGEVSEPNEEFTAAFVLGNNTLLRFVDGRILLRYRRDRFNLDGTPRDVQFSLDGVGGTGDFRLVLIR